MSPRFHIVLAGVSLAVLGACGHSPETISYVNGSHRQIQAHEVTAELKLDAVVSGEKLGETERDAVKYFAAAYEEEGHGAIIISRPSNGSNDSSAMRAASDARAVLLAEGIDAGRITEGPYDASGARYAPLVITYRTYEAVVPDCPDLSQIDFTKTASNSVLPSFGCATAVNLAAMIADPSDLVGEQRMDPSDITRRGVVLSKYRNGDATNSTRAKEASGAISEAVGQ